jgi:hypothetical protein
VASLIGKVKLNSVLPTLEEIGMSMIVYAKVKNIEIGNLEDTGDGFIRTMTVETEDHGMQTVMFVGEKEVDLGLLFKNDNKEEENDK